MKEAPLLDLEHVSVDYFVRRSLWQSRPIQAVIDVSLTLERGETLALVGESGSGKSTLGRATLRLVPLASGRILFDGQDIARLSAREVRRFRERAQVIFQDPFSSLSPFMRVGEIVEEPLVIHGPASRAERAALVLEALEQVKLRPAAEFAESYPHRLSGGQRQRVSIARAMVLRPEYLVADEPVSMIDASSRAEILGLLDELQSQRQLTYLYITHDLASARHLAERIAVMYAGRIVELAPSADLVASPRHPYTQALLAAVPEPDPANRLRIRPIVGGEPPDAGDLPTGCTFHPRCPAFMSGICDIQVPPLIPLADGRLVACHLYPAAATGDGEPSAVGAAAGEPSAVGAASGEPSAVGAASGEPSAVGSPAGEPSAVGSSAGEPSAAPSTSSAASMKGSSDSG
jgi:oligopeptide/dipeptide ABC transporter ATP-binding protein